MVISSPKASNARSCLPWPCAIHHISGHILASSGKTGSHKPWASDPLYPAPHYSLSYWSSILIAWHGSWVLLSAEWSQIWALWHSTCRSMWPPLPQSPDTYPSPRVQGYLGSPYVKWASSNGSLHILPMLSSQSYMMELSGELLLFIPEAERPW